MSLVDRIKFLEDFNLRLVWITMHEIESNQEYPRVSFANTIIWVVLGGRKRIEVRGSFYDTVAGDIIVFPSQTPRAVLSTESSDSFTYITIGCDVRVASMDFFELYKVPFLVHPENASAYRRLVDISHTLRSEASTILQKLGILNRPDVQVNHVNTDQTLDLLIMKQLLLTWFTTFIETIRPYLPDEPIAVDPRLREICARLQDNLTDELDISQLAGSVYLSESHLRLLFRKTFGYSPREYLLRLRLHRSKQLLAGTDNSLTQISEMAGFENLYKFSRTFSREEGMTASDYRKMYRT